LKKPVYSTSEAKGFAWFGKYWDKLFADPKTVDTPNGQITIQPQRTNNILERFFRDLKRSNRKKSGTISLNKTLKSIICYNSKIVPLKELIHSKVNCLLYHSKVSQVLGDNHGTYLVSKGRS